MLDYMNKGNELAYRVGFADGYKMYALANTHELAMLVTEVRMQDVSELIDIGYLEGLEFALTMKRRQAKYMNDYSMYEYNLRCGIKK